MKSEWRGGKRGKVGCCKTGGVQTAYIALSTLVCASALTEPETLDGRNSARNRRHPYICCATRRRRISSVVGSPSGVHSRRNSLSLNSQRSARPSASRVSARISYLIPTQCTRRAVTGGGTVRRTKGAPITVNLISCLNSGGGVPSIKFCILVPVHLRSHYCSHFLCSAPTSHLVF